MSNLLNSADAIKSLAEKLSKSEKVNRYNHGKEKEAWTLSNGFSDLEKSFKVFIEELLPQLLREDISEEEIDEALWDIGDEFRHILYHIKDSKYFGYLEEE